MTDLFTQFNIFMQIKALQGHIEMTFQVIQLYKEESE